MSLFNFTKPLEKSGFFQGLTDWHCHILPGVDDGFKSVPDSLAALELYERAGISEVWLTPHIMEDIPNTTAFLKERFMELSEAYKGPVILHLASENMLDSIFSERLEESDLLPLPGHNLLVETSYYNPPMDLTATLGQIKAAGYFPVLAHPERYRYMDREGFKKIRSLGVRFQLNIASLGGMYGMTARDKAFWMLENSMYDLCGTDLHRIEAMEAMLALKLKQSHIDRLLMLKLALI